LRRHPKTNAFPNRKSLIHKKIEHFRALFTWSRQESNRDPGLRRPLYYPLYYGTRPSFASAAEPGVAGFAKEGEVTNYFNNPLRLVLNILTAIANRITPKNFRVAIIPAGPRILSIRSMDFRTRKMNSRFNIMPIRTVVVS
jgi:hypothetical protein